MFISTINHKKPLNFFNIKNNTWKYRFKTIFRGSNIVTSYIYIYIYICLCVCVCVCVPDGFYRVRCQTAKERASYACVSTVILNQPQTYMKVHARELLNEIASTINLNSLSSAILSDAAGVFVFFKIFDGFIAVSFLILRIVATYSNVSRIYSEQ